jgi:hypothetical protein
MWPVASPEVPQTPFFLKNVTLYQQNLSAPVEAAQIEGETQIFHVRSDVPMNRYALPAPVLVSTSSLTLSV